MRASSLFLLPLLTICTGALAAPNSAPYIGNSASTALAPPPRASPVDDDDAAAAGPAASASTTTAASTTSTTTGGFTLRTGLPRNIAYHSYYRNADNASVSLLPLVQHDSNITHIILFVSELQSEPGNITIGGVVPTSPFLGNLWSEVAQVQSRGVKVLASMGGYNGASYLLLQQNFSAYYPAIPSFLKQYRLDGLDLDIEPANGGATVTGIATPLELIRALRADMPPDFLVTMAPVAADLSSSPPEYSGFSYAQLDAAAVNATTGRRMIDWFNAQFYNGWGSPASTASYDDCVQAGWNASRVVMGVLADRHEGSGFVAIDALRETVGALSAKYADFGGVDGYEDYRAGESDNLTAWQWYGEVYGATGT